MENASMLMPTVGVASVTAVFFGLSCERVRRLQWLQWRRRWVALHPWERAAVRAGADWRTWLMIVLLPLLSSPITSTFTCR